MTELIYENRAAINTFLLTLAVICLGTSCEREPNPSLANVFSPWDGKWQGIFVVYEDTTGQHDTLVQVREVSKELLESLPLKVSLTVNVEQEYNSESPYYQTVEITDRYEDGDGNIKEVKSSGYNKVEGDQLLCVVNKPDEQVIHKGSIPAPNTIVWERDLRDPLKIEYFYEEVEDDTYFIIGWGYYGDDNPDLSPKTWFYAAYKRKK